MERTWKPTASGILAIVAASLGLLVGIGLGVSFLLAGKVDFIPWFPAHAMWFYILALSGIILSIVAIVRGVYALEKRSWGLALAGAICALPARFLLGILAIIFIIMGKNEFE